MNTVIQPFIQTYTTSGTVMLLSMSVPLYPVTDKEEIIRYNQKIQDMVNLEQVLALFNDLQTKGYETKNDTIVARFLTENKKNYFLASFIGQTICKLEKQYTHSLKKIYLEVIQDPEENAEPVLFIKIQTTLTPQKTFTLLLQFCKEWFIPMAGDRILQCNIDFI